MNKERRKEEYLQELKGHILPFWMSLKDEKNGGFFGYMDSELRVDRDARKGCVLNSRILWTFSRAYLAFQDEIYLSYAKQAFLFMKKRFHDTVNGGLYWSVTSEGMPFDTTKQSYNIAFAIYALSSYYEAAKDKKALGMAKEFFLLLESRFRDAYGYREALSRAFQPAINEHLSENGVLADKTMNTVLHIFEAYTELYRVSSFSMVRNKLIFLLGVIKNRIFNEKKRRLEVFFDEKMNSLLNMNSYGHDIEAAWLLDRGLTVLKDRELSDEMEPLIKTLEQEVLRSAYDGESLISEKVKGKVLTKRIWWVQCEAVIGFMNAYQKHPRKKLFLEASDHIFEYIKESFIDRREGGEWFNERFEDKTLDRKMPVVSEWKCPYHNSRLCFEMIQRLSQMEEA